MVSWLNQNNNVLTIIVFLGTRERYPLGGAHPFFKIQFGQKLNQPTCVFNTGEVYNMCNTHSIQDPPLFFCPNVITDQRLED